VASTKLIAIKGLSIALEQKNDFNCLTMVMKKENRYNWASFSGIVLFLGVASNIHLTCVLAAEESQTATPPIQEVVGDRVSIPLSPELPYDVDVGKVRKLDDEGKIPIAQKEFDILAWQTFIALNWPADKDGQPDKSKTIADSNGLRVWNFWRSADSIFLPDGAKPAPWEDTSSFSEEPLTKTKAAWRQHSTSADQNFQAFSGPLVDQNGKWVRYQVLVNREEFEYIFKNELYSQDGQVKFSQRPQENTVDFPVNEGTKRHGAIEIKLAWKELGEHDDKTRFYHRPVTVTVAEPAKQGEPPKSREIEAGLVGMHISMRTQSSPEWIWATFEQIDNVRVNHYSNGKPVHPNFFNPELLQPVNVLPPKNAITDSNTGATSVVTDTTTPTTWVESLTTTPVQLARVPVPTQRTLNPLDKELGLVATAINKEVQALLQKANSVFQYYELIDVQWPVHPNALAFAGGDNSAPGSITHKTPGDIVPVFLVNTTMETYFQKGMQPAGPLEQDDRLAQGAPPIDNTPVFGTESCAGCHYSSGIAVGFKTDDKGKEIVDLNWLPTPIYGENNHFGKTAGANFSWLLQIEAKARPRVPEGKEIKERRMESKQPSNLLDIKKYLDPATKARLGE
jgi:hypothetical protein